MRSLLKLLSKEDMDKIHRATVKVLEKTGVKFLHDEALSILEKNGVLVDWKTKIAKIPESVFDEFRGKAPNEFPTFNRNGKRIPIAKDDFHIATFGDGTYFTDRDGTQRPSTLKDIEKIMIVGDALENVDTAWVGSMPTDLHPNVQMIHSMEVEINNSPTKTVYLEGENGDQMRYAMRIGAALLGGMEELRKTPVLVGGGWATSPLVHANEILDSQIMAAKEGLPTCCGSMATAITTAPATLAGTLVVWNAEVMSSLVLSQMIAPGVPFDIQCSGSAADPRKGYYPVGNPEMALVNAGCMELSNYYDLPCLIAGC
ncbi:MAG: trimethylamine methyltransferase family protein [Candidatus Bathyarchaeota archaeon]|nr:MAG: trimethylamine methyltransferase family protein [Candidatus Bathyarchaeota archaeon]